MKKLFFLFYILIMMLSACTKKEVVDNSQNPFFQKNDTPYGIVPFEKIKVEHFMPAFTEAIKIHSEEIKAIENNKAAPTFENTIEALDYSGEMLNLVSKTFDVLYNANTNDSLDQIAEEVSPMLSEHNDNLYLNKKLFHRIQIIYKSAEADSLNAEQKRLLEEYYKNFVRSGALLTDKSKNRLRVINKDIARLELIFAKNVLAETNAFKLILDKKSDLAGLTEDQITAAAQEAKDNGMVGKWVFTLQKPSLIPFLQYSQRRDLREKMFKAYIHLANNNNQSDNKSIVAKLVNLRLEKAQLLGFENHADFMLDDTMAKTPERVYSLLDDIWHAALPKAKREAAELQKLIDAEGGNFKLQAWDWWYYAEKLRKEKYDMNADSIKPYFQLENVRQGAFLLANKLWGLQFKPLKNMPVYDKDVEVFEVLDADNSHLGILYTDYFPRDNKRSGAWMEELSGQYIKNGVNVRPVVINVGNFTKPTADKPSLLTIEEVETMFHEFGHALHALLSQCTYPTLSGTNVTRDFVELPSQLMENWATEPEMLRLYAKHYKTGEVISDNLIEKLQEMKKFNQGFYTVELISAAILDLDWHTILEKKEINVSEFEKNSMDNICLIPEIAPRYSSTYFSHIFSMGYDAGYYSYLWSEVLDADAFEAFKETGDIFNKELARSYRTNILEKGNSREPVLSYRNFRGYDPSPKALMIRRGLR